MRSRPRSAPERQTQSRSHERMAAERDGYRSVLRRVGECAQPSVADEVRQQQVRGKTVLGIWPGSLVGAQAMRKEDPRIDHGRIGEIGDDRSEGSRTVRIENVPKQ